MLHCILGAPIITHPLLPECIATLINDAAALSLCDFILTICFYFCCDFLLPCFTMLKKRHVSKIKTLNLSRSDQIKPSSHCGILATIWSSETNFENPKRFL